MADKKIYNPRTGKKEIVKSTQIKKVAKKKVVTKKVAPKKVAIKKDYKKNDSSVINIPNKEQKEIIKKEEKERRRIESTLANKSKEFTQSWCASPLKLRHKIEEYFNNGGKIIKDKDGEIKEIRYTVTGLAYYLGFSSRASLDKFGERPNFKDVIATGKLRIEMYVEERVIYSNNPTGPIFWLKNFGWTDNSKTDLNITVNPLEKLIRQASVSTLPKEIKLKNIDIDAE